MPKPFRWKKAPLITTPIPMVAALGRAPVVGDTWRVRDSGTSPASANIHQGSLAVPLQDKDEPCSKCKTPNHNDAIRTHELLHVKVSPVQVEELRISKAWVEWAEKHVEDYSMDYTLFASIYGEGYLDMDQSELIPVSSETGEVAEEYIIEELRKELIGFRGGNKFFCLPNFKTSFFKLLVEKKYKDAILLYVSIGKDYDVDRYVYKLARGTYLGKLRRTLAGKVLSEYADDFYLFTERLRAAVYRGEAHARALPDTKREKIERKRKAVRIALWLFTKKLEKKKAEPVQGTLKQMVDDGEVAEDLASMFKELSRYTREDEGKLVEAMRKHVIEKKEDTTEKPIEWGVMTIERPPLVKKLPLWKIQRKNTPTDEGTIPMYMHRYSVDQRVFRKITRELGASVLIDDSGSMGMTAAQVDEIIAHVPGVVIAAYAGQSGRGILKILAEKGKRVATGDTKVGMNGNEIDKPALEWLAQQPEPRIWVSDGQVIYPSGGYTMRGVADCAKVCVENRISRANNVKEAKEMLTGKRELHR